LSQHSIQRCFFFIIAKGTFINFIKRKEDQEKYKTIPQIEKAVGKIKKEMEKAARDLDFMEAARLRDEMFLMQKKLEEMKK